MQSLKVNYYFEVNSTPPLQKTISLSLSPDVGLSDAFDTEAKLFWDYCLY